MGQTSVPAAWYPDPADSRQLRFWDGMGWTGQLAPNPHVAAEPHATPSSTLSRRQLRERGEAAHVAEPITGSVQFIPSPSTMVEPDYSYIPMVRGTSSSAPIRAIRPVGPTSTPAVWLYVIAPLLSAPFLIVGPGFDTGDVWSVARAALLGVMVVALAVLAGLDHVQLQRREVPNAPTGLVGIIPIVFVIDRTARVGKSGVPVLIVSLVVQAAIAALVIWRIYPILA